MSAKRKHGAGAVEEESVDPSDELLFLCLGGGNEVGRSCHIIQYKGKTVMLDAGMHPALDGFAALPFYDDFDLSTVDVLLISHFHIDHAASLPYVLAKTNFRGRIFMTHSTKAIYKWLIQDSVRLGNTSSSSESNAQLYTEADHLTTFPRIEAIDYHTTHTVSSIRITPHPAGHVLGAAMFHLEIAGLSILFTGDYSREHDRHLIPATFPPTIKVDVLITESTYGVATHVPRLEREAALMKAVTSVLDRGGRALLPVFALGRAQELLLIFDEYWARHPEYQKIPIYYASNLARKCMVVYQTYIGAMNENIKRLFRERMAEAEASGTLSAGGTGAGPWDFRFIRSLKSLDRFDDVGGCVMLASPGMMQSGVSRELLERWAPDQRNGVIITGYSVEGTMAKTIMNEPEEIPAVMNRGARGGGKGGMFSKSAEDEKTMIPRRCTIQEFSFAAHVDGKENQEFINEVNPSVIILVHGEKHNMMRLRSKLVSTNTTRPTNAQIKVHSPANCQELRIPIRTAKLARVVGKLAERVNPRRSTSPASVYPPSPSLTPSPQSPQSQLLVRSESEADGYTLGGELIRNAVLVQNDLKLSLMEPEDLREYAGLMTTTIICKQKVRAASAGPELIRWALEGSFTGIVDVSENRFARPEDRAKNKARRSIGGADSDVKMEGNDSDAEVDNEEADEEIDRSLTRLLIMDTVLVTYSGQGEIDVEWEGNMMNDGLADSVLSALAAVESSPGAVKQSSQLHNHSHSHSHSQTNGNGASPSSSTSLANNAPPPKSQSQSTSDPAARLHRVLQNLELQFSFDAITPVLLPTPSAASNEIDATTAGKALEDTKPETSAQPASANGSQPVPQEITTTALTKHIANLSYTSTSTSTTPNGSSESTDLAHSQTPALHIKSGGQTVTVYLDDFRVEGGNATTRDRVRGAVEKSGGEGGVWGR